MANPRQNRRRLIGTAAVSAAALASLAGAPGAGGADPGDSCTTDVCFGYPQPGLNNAFFKLSDRDLPGSTADAFAKVGGLNAFAKVAGLEFPGSTGDVFAK